MKANFIKVTDESTAEMLIKLGYQLVQKDPSCWTFLNDTEKPRIFDEKKVAYTNVLTI